MSIHQRPTALETGDPSEMSVERSLDRRNTQLLRLSTALVDYDNDCTDREYAVEAIGAGRAAFWRTTGYNNAVGGMLTVEANRGAEIIEFCIARQIGRPKGFIVKNGLDVLIPLNRKATSELLAAYEAFGEWRTAAELEARCVRAPASLAR